MKSLYDVIIIGGGQAGLVQGYYLQQHNIDFVILDANETIGGSWHQYWDSVQLFSSAKYSSLDGMPFPAPDDYYPNRQDVIQYLQKYTHRFSLPVINNVRVQRIHKNETFEVLTEDGNCYRARAVISATGPFTKPYIPEFIGQDTFTGKQLHSYQYDSPESYVGQRIVVVGSNNSAVQVAVELASVADVSLAVRKEINFSPTHHFGIDVFFFLHGTGFDMLPLGCKYGLCISSAVYDDGRYQDAVEAGNPDARAMFTHITDNGVVWSTREEESVDTILYATGFSPSNKPYLCELDALDNSGVPIHEKGVSTAVEGLFYVGLEGQIAPASATIRGVSRDARYVADHVAHYL